MLFFDNTKMKKEQGKFSETALCSPTSVTLTWRNVTCTAEKRTRAVISDFLWKRRGEYVKLLSGVSGIISSGSMLAILGPSGAGKTTLLATLSKRVKGCPAGDILLNGTVVDSKFMARISGFVPQDDLVIESLTVQEHMMFMAKMKMDRRYRRIARSQRIEILLADLGLNELKESKLLTLSGGERKRVSLAVELLTEPRILFCDEPTTGLDSYSAGVVVKILQDISAKGRIVICTLHQPASGLLDHFHQVLLLVKNGSVAFQGSIDNAKQFFTSLDLHCPKSFNYAEFFVSQLSVTRGKERECERKIQSICNEFKKSTYYKDLNYLINESVNSKSSNVNQTFRSLFCEKSLPVDDFKKVRILTQLDWLVWRNFIDYKRNFSRVVLKFFIYIVGGILLASPYIKVEENMDQRSIQNLQGFLYFAVTETAFTFTYAVFYTFPKELPIFIRDIAGGLYHPAPYYISKIIILLLGSFTQPFIYSGLIYLMTGLQGGFLGFLLFAIPLALCATSASAIGCFMSAAFESIETASLVSVPIDFLGLIFSGLYLSLGDSTYKFAWLKYLSLFFYSAEAVSLMQWKQFNNISCSPHPEGPCIKTGLGVLEKYGFAPQNYLFDLLGLFSIFLVGHLAGFSAVYIRSRKQPIY